MNPAAPDGLPPLREVVRALGIEPRRALGQNFLFDLNLTGRIARAAGPLDGRVVLEIGPGPGGLTRALLAHDAAHVVAVERDPRCLPALAAIGNAHPGRLTVVEADALSLDPAELASRAGLPDAPVRIVSNLPYNIGTALLTGWVATETWPPIWESATLMFQREVAERIVADRTRPGDYGRLGVLCGWRTTARILFDVAPSNFVPPPKVTSAIVHLVPNPVPLPCRLRSLEAVTRAAFGQRRKMLRQSLKGLGVEPAALLGAAGLAGTARPEEIAVSGFVDLANALSSHRPDQPPPSS